MRTVSVFSKVLSSVGMLAIGDALAFALSPTKHVRVWSFRREPRWYRRMTADALESRKRAFAMVAVELAAGLGLSAAAQRLAARRG